MSSAFNWLLTQLPPSFQKPALACGSALQLHQLERRLLLSAQPGLEALANHDQVAAHASAQAPPVNPRTEMVAYDQSEVADAIGTKELVIIDAAVNNYERLIEDAEQQRAEGSALEYVLLNAHADGISQVSRILANYDQLDAIHLVAHGSGDGFQVGKTWMTHDNLNAYAGMIAGWQDAISRDGDLLLYGCDLSSTEQGRTLLDSLGALCDCDVAASDNTSDSMAVPIQDDSTDETAAVANTPPFDPTLPLEVVFVDSSVEDADTLLNGLRDDSEDQTQWWVVELSVDDDGVKQITRELLELSGVDAIHILSHGDGQGIGLGNTRLDIESAVGYASDISSWRNSLDKGADLLIYGCDLASTADGRALIESIGALCDCDVAASDDATGHDALGGDWDLEYQVGSVEVGVAFNSQTRSSWRGLLATYTVTNTNDSGAGSLRQAILDANASVGVDDTIDFNISTADSGYVDPDGTPGNGDEYWTILPTSFLGYITDTVVLDATTQPGYDPVNGQPVIEIDGSSMGSGTAGLVLRTDNSTIRGFSVHSSPDEGIEIDGSTGFGNNNTFQNNWVGIDPEGNILGNTQHGILLSSNADSNLIGGTGSNDGNVVGGTQAGYAALMLQQASSNNNIEGNFLGVLADGVTSSLNAGNGLLINLSSDGNTIGGTVAGAGNVISRNAGDGIHIDGTTNGTFVTPVTGTVIKGNFIGTDASGTVAVGNGDEGINISNNVSNTTIGGSTSAARNIISGNDGAGIVLQDGTTTTSVQGNYIGTGVGGTLDLGNGKVAASGDKSGIRVWNAGTGNLIGGTGVGEGNLIAFNDEGGVVISGTSTGASMLGNSIHSNVGLGIDLAGDGVTTNDAGDGDTGPNDLMNVPVFTSVSYAGNTITINYDLDVTAGNYRIEFFVSDLAEGTGYGEGKALVSSPHITHTGSGVESFSTSFALASAGYISATATQDLGGGNFGNTSEFNLAVETNDAPEMASWYDNNWSFRKELVVSAGQVSGDLVGFPILVDLSTDADLASFAQTDGDDILFTSADGTTKLAHEIEVFTSATGELVAWVKTDLSALQDTRLYMYYGNGSAADQQDAANVWDASYQGVWHLNNSPTGAAGEIVDSTSHSNDGTTEGSMDAIDLVASKIGTGLDFDEVDDLIRVGNSASLDSTATTATIELWVNWDNVADGDHQIVMTSSNRFTTGAKDGYEWASQGNGNHFYYPEGGTDPNYVLGPSPYTNGAWHHVALTQDFSTKDVEIYVDGTAMSFTSDTLSTTWTTLADPSDWLWGGNPDRATRYFDGMMDEIRVSNVVRSQEWIQTSVSNQTDPGTFISLGSAEIQNLTLTDINEDDTHPTGDTIASLIASVGGDRITDVDTAAVEGIAVIGVDNTNGTWQYDSGGGWTSFGAVSDNSAVLLDDTAKIRFVPDANYNGPSGNITFRAWDQSDANPSGTVAVDVSTNGGISAYSSVTDSVDLHVLAVNDEESLDTNAGLTLSEGATSTITATELATSDVDNIPSQIIYTVDSAASNGTLSLNWIALSATDTFTQADIDAGLVKYRHDGGETTSDGFDFTVNDSAGTSTSATFNFTINPFNDAPVNMFSGQPQTVASAGVDGATDVHAADLDGDGDVDLVSTSWTDDRVTWFQNDGSGSFSEYTIDTGLTGARHVFVADINGDTLMDVLVSDYEGDTVTWYENDGTTTPSFTAQTVTNIADGAWSSYAIDMDGDGDMDVLSASIWDDKVAWYENNGAATPGWTEHVIATTADGVRTVVAGDLDNDGDIDVATASYLDDTIAWYESDGAATPGFTEHVVSTNALGAMSVEIADVDADGDLDLITASYADGKIAWFQNDGAVNPTFAEQLISISAAGARDVTTADMDGDGDLDIVSASFVDDKFAWYENDGAALPSFTERLVSQDGDGPRAVAAADMDGDGDIDVVGASLNDDKVGFFENTDGQMGIQVTAEETPLTFNAANNNLVWISDSDAGGLEMKVRLEITNGTISLSGTTGLTFDVGAGTSDAIVEFRGSATSINAALDGMIFTPTTDFNGVASIRILTDDQGNRGSGGALADDDTINITVTPVNDEQVLATNTGTTVNEASTGNVLTTTMLETTDVDNAPGQLAYTVTGTTANGTLRLSGTTLGISDTFTQADVDAGLVTYDHNGSETLSDAFDFSVNDGAGTTTSGTFNITVAPVNDEQVLATNTGTTVNEASTGNVLTTAMLETTDVDNAPGQLVYTVTRTTANGTLRLSGTALGVSDTFTQADVDAGLVTYDHNGSATVSDAFDFSVSDGAGITTSTFNISITLANNAPFLDLDADDSAGLPGTDYATTYNEDAAPIAVVDTDATLFDVDSVTLNSVLVTLTNLIDVGAESLAADTNGTSITATFNPITGVLTLSGVDAVSNYEQVLRTVTYTNSAQVPTTTDRIITFVANDGVATSNPATATVQVLTVNDAPTLTFPPTVTVDEDSSLIFSIASGNPIVMGDVDAAGNLMEFTLSVANGTLSLSGTEGLWFSVGDGIADTAITFRGALGDINAALNGLRFDPIANYHGAVTLNLMASDLGNTGVGGPQIVSNAVAITVNRVNDAPIATNNNYALAEDTTLTGNLILDDSGLGTDGDVDGDPITATAVTQPANGTVIINTDGSFSYTPDDNFFGTDLFTYEVWDGTASTTANVSLNVSPVNDAPVGAPDSFAVGSQQVLVLSTTQLLLNDVDLDGDGLSLAIATAPSHGNLVQSAGSVMIYVPDQAFVGTDSFTYLLSDGTTSTLVEVTITVAPAPFVNSGANQPNNHTETANSNEEDDVILLTAPLVSVRDIVTSQTTTKVSTNRVRAVPDHAGLQEQLIVTLSTFEADELFVRQESKIVDVAVTMDDVNAARPRRAGFKMPVLMLDTGKLWNGFDQFQERLAQDMAAQQLFVKAAQVLSTGISAGYIVWTLRGSYLVAFLSAALPSWVDFDPIPVLDAKGWKQLRRNQNREFQGESLQELAVSGLGIS